MSVISARPCNPESPATAGSPVLRTAALTAFTTIDFPGRLAAVVWVQGCPWRCAYCHNTHLQPRHASPQAQAAAITWPAVMDALRRRVGFLDGVVFSGGEPTTDPALPQAMAEVRRLGLQVGLHTAGLAPRRLAGLLPQLDWVGLDLKAPLDATQQALHDRIVGRRGQQAAVAQSLGLLRQRHQASGLAWECRSTVHPDWHDEAALWAMAGDVAAAAAPTWVLQTVQPHGAAQGLDPVPPDWPPATWLQRLRERVPGLQLRP